MRCYICTKSCTVDWLRPTSRERLLRDLRAYLAYYFGW